MAVPNTFGTATSAIPLSQLDANFNTPITLGNTAIQLGDTVTTLNNMTLANVTISSGNVTITNVAITTANVSGTANISTLVVVGNATVGGNTTITGNITAANANVTTNLVLSNGTANGVAYLNVAKVLTTGSALVFDGTNLGVGESTPTAKLQIGVATAAVNGTKGLRIANPAGTIVMLECGSGGDSFVGTESGSTFNIRTGNAINATFLTSGNVGFGETNPTQRLHFKGSGTTYALAETTGSGTSSGFRMKAGAGTDFTLYTTEGGNQFGIYNNTTSTQPLTINANGALALLGGSTSATGVGITFPATQSASSDANTLDDYEEGTWLPVLTGDSGGTAMTYTTQIGKYTKIGNVVIADAYILLSNRGTITGNVIITGLPLPVAPSTYNLAINWGYYAGLGVAWASVGGWLNAGDTIYLAGQKTSGTTITPMAQADVSNTFRINVSVTYTV